jgi:release factor glutamine methyltransferase
MADIPIRALLKDGERVLADGPHAERAHRDAELLMRHSLRRGRVWLLGHHDRQISALDAEKYLHLVERRRRGEPVQYITRSVEFFGITLAVTPKVLIPRPETEHLVEKAIELAHRFPNPRILDVGTGSGAIAIAIAHDTPLSANITATDLSRSALKIARFNAQGTGFANRIQFLQGDLLTPVAQEKFDIIVSNPPYVPESDRPTLSVEVRDHEPSLALFAGPDGLDIYRRLIPQAFTCLVPGGYLALEIGYGQSSAIADLLTTCGFQKIEFLPDLQGIPRVTSAQHP